MAYNKKGIRLEDLTCNCKKSKCLKLYCQCFAARAFCQGTCKCTMCSNSADNIDAINTAVTVITERNPSAFECKFMEGGNKEDVVHKIGCRCRKSMCLKKYCECFQAQIACSDSCICLDCCNTLETSTSKPQPRLEPDIKPVPVFTADSGVSKKRPTDSIMRAADNLSGLRVKKAKLAAAAAAAVAAAPSSAVPVATSSSAPVSMAVNVAPTAASGRPVREGAGRLGRPPVHPQSRRVVEHAPVSAPFMEKRGGSFSPIVSMPNFGMRTASPNSMHCAWALALLVKDGVEGSPPAGMPPQDYDSGLGTDTVTTDEESSLTSHEPKSVMEMELDLDRSRSISIHAIVGAGTSQVGQ